MPYDYQAFGLRIRSCLPLPQFQPASYDGPFDLVVTFGDLPERLEGGTRIDGLVEAGRHGVLVRCRGRSLAYLHRDGRVDVAGVEPETMPLLRQILMGSVTGALLHLRGGLPLHGSGVSGANGGLLFLGEAGAGKSTTAAVLASRPGWRFLTDDIAAVDSRAGVPVIRPAYAVHKLWRSEVEALGISTDGFERVDARDKYYVPADAPHTHEPVPLRHLVVLETGPQPALAPVAVRERVGLVLQHTYRPRLLHALDSAATHLERAAALAHVPMWRLTRSPERERLPEALDLLEEAGLGSGEK